MLFSLLRSLNVTLRLNLFALLTGVLPASPVITEFKNRIDPASPAWNSVATGTRDAGASLQPVNLNVTAFRSALVVGTNKLAVQGCNITAADNSFLLLPTLTGGNLQPGGPFYFNAATDLWRTPLSATNGASTPHPLP